MKKIISVLLAVAMVAAMFSGCRAPGPLRVCVDLAYANGDFNKNIEQKLYDLEYEVKNFDGVEDIIFEYVPPTGAERETALDRLRTEIMSGGGPDLFLIESAGAYNNVPSGEALFLMPEKAMELGLFMPLDKYMENNSQYAEWDRMTKSVLDAGKTEDGQMIIPITYTVPVTMYLKEDVPHTPSKTVTWQDMLEDEKLKDAAAVLADGMIPNTIRYENDKWYYGIDAPVYAMIGDLADYKNEQLSFTEEELLGYVDQVFALKEEVQRSDILFREKWYEGYMGVGMGCCAWNQSETHGMKDEDSFSLVPFYSDDGGATAVILNYMAVNANSKRPEDAFKVIDRLMSPKMQQQGKIYIEYLYSGYGAMPMYDNITHSSEPIKYNYFVHQQTFYSDENFQTVCDLRDSIARVQFPDALSLTLYDMMLDCHKAKDKGESYEQIVRDAYNAMALTVGE